MMTRAEAANGESREFDVVAIPPFQPVVLNDCVYLGGYGCELKVGQAASLRFTHKELKTTGVAAISYAQLTDIGISGPGSVTTGGGFIGGGFGVAGALEGIALASILNSLTTKTKVHTFLSLTTHVGELHFHFGGMEPAALRIALSPVFCALRRMQPEWVLRQRDGLRWNREHGQITDDEYARYMVELAQGSIENREVGGGRGESQIIATCEAQLKALGCEIRRTEPSKWEIRGKGGISYAYSVEDLEQRAKEIARWATAT